MRYHTIREPSHEPTKGNRSANDDPPYALGAYTALQFALERLHHGHCLLVELPLKARKVLLHIFQIASDAIHLPSEQIQPVKNHPPGFMGQLILLSPILHEGLNRPIQLAHSRKQASEDVVKIVAAAFPHRTNPSAR